MSATPMMRTDSIPLPSANSLDEGVRSDNPFWSSLSDATTQEGRSLLAIADEKPTLVIFLRHLGCTFCRETLADISSRKQFMKEKGVQPVFVHMSEESPSTASLFAKYEVEDIPRISDPDKRLYRAFGLERGTVGQVMGLRAIIRGAVTALFKGYGFGRVQGDPFQMPGVFLLYRGRILKDFRHAYSSDRPPYESFGDCEGCS